MKAHLVSLHGGGIFDKISKTVGSLLPIAMTLGTMAQIGADPKSRLGQAVNSNSFRMAQVATPLLSSMLTN